jgi:hypothetical protein
VSSVNLRSLRLHQEHVINAYKYFTEEHLKERVTWET